MSTCRCSDSGACESTQWKTTTSNASSSSGNRRPSPHGTIPAASSRAFASRIGSHEVSLLGIQTLVAWDRGVGDRFEVFRGRRRSPLTVTTCRRGGGNVGWVRLVSCVGRRSVCVSGSRYGRPAMNRRNRLSDGSHVSQILAPLDVGDRLPWKLDREGRPQWLLVVDVLSATNYLVQPCDARVMLL